MTLEQLRIFVAVAERQHMTEGARALNLTQSAVSAAVAALEARHGLRLFDRVGRGIALTEAGRLFLAEARAVIARALAAEATLDDLTQLRRGRLRLIASQTVANHWIPGRMMRFRARHPGIALDLRIANTATASEAVAEGLVDLGFVEDEIRDARLQARRVADDRLVLVAAAGHPLATDEVPDPGALTEAAWVLREHGSGTRAILEGALRAAGVGREALRVVLELPSNEAVRAALEAGGALGVLPLGVANDALQAGTLREVPFPLPSRGFHAIQARDRSLTRAAEAFLATLDEKPPPEG